jgi:hypothetical protein
MARLVQVGLSPPNDERSSRLVHPADFDAWVSVRTAEELSEPFTFVVDQIGALRLAPRRSEHVCAPVEKRS